MPTTVDPIPSLRCVVGRGVVVMWWHRTDLPPQLGGPQPRWQQARVRIMLPSVPFRSVSHAGPMTCGGGGDGTQRNDPLFRPSITPHPRGAPIVCSHAVWCGVCVAYVCIVSYVVRSLCAEVCNMRNLRELTLEGNEGLAELPDLSFFPSLQVLRVPTTKRYPIPRYRPDPASRLACSPASPLFTTRRWRQRRECGRRRGRVELPAGLRAGGTRTKAVATFRPRSPLPAIHHVRTGTSPPQP